MQFHKAGGTDAAYGVKNTWEEALEAPGASQLIYLKKLMLSESYFDRIPAQDLIADKQGEKYDYIAATRGKDYAFIYTCNGSIMNIDIEKMNLPMIKASWYNPRTGEFTLLGTIKSEGTKSFDPPGEKANGNDWVLVLERG